jgi:hypothetical protein
MVISNLASYKCCDRNFFTKKGSVCNIMYRCKYSYIMNFINVGIQFCKPVNDMPRNIRFSLASSLILGMTGLRPHKG